MLGCILFILSYDSSIWQSGRKYDVKQIKFGKYIDDLKAGNARSRNSYLAVQNIKKAFPQLQVPLQSQV